MLLQLIGVGDFGSDLDMDMDGDIDGAGVANGLLSFLGLGRLPIMIWLTLFLLLFALLGYSGQQIVDNLTSSLLPSLIAAPLAFLAALPATALLARPLHRVMPRDESTAVSIDSLVGRFAEIENGTALPGFPARAKVKDAFGHPHFVMVEPDNDGQIFQSGEKLLLVRREGNLFKAISQGPEHLVRLEAR